MATARSCLLPTLERPLTRPSRSASLSASSGVTRLEHSSVATTPTATAPPKMAGMATGVETTPPKRPSSATFPSSRAALLTPPAASASSSPRTT
ncbi:unnamed protein product [Tilletia controversa]|nr:unnamed protein product [Tilletia controversa]CAD6925108.1 unnamed protein product [Tilletia controversa]CAD6929373.1 unnamed protein product [Tilletia controversa]